MCVTSVFCNLTVRGTEKLRKTMLMKNITFSTCKMKFVIRYSKKLTLKETVKFLFCKVLKLKMEKTVCRHRLA